MALRLLKVLAPGISGESSTDFSLSVLFFFILRVLKLSEQNKHKTCEVHVCKYINN